MIPSAFLVLRECAELMLIVWAMRTCLTSTQRRDLLRQLHAGVAAGLALGALSIVMFVQRDWGVRADAALSIVVGLGVLFMACAVFSSSTDIGAYVAGWLHGALERPGGSALVAGFAAMASWREAVELGVFLHASALRQGALDVWAGVALGLATALLAARAFHFLQARVSLSVLFRLSSLLLCLIAIQLALEGLGRLLVSFAGPGASVAEEILAPDGKAFAYLCALLMVVPVVIVIRRWWRQTVSD